MASKVTPLYAQTRILLNLWALDETPAAKSKFAPKEKDHRKAYKAALDQLVVEGDLEETPKNKRIVYSLTDSGKAKLAKNLADEVFTFSSNMGPKTTNALLSWIRTQGSMGLAIDSDSEQAIEKAAQANGNHTNGKAPQISSYDEFTKTALKTYDQLNQDYNLDDLVPIYRIRREMGDRLPRQKFNEWLLEVQANDIVQLMGSDLSNVTSDQMEDSLTIPGAGARFFVKRLS